MKNIKFKHVLAISLILGIHFALTAQVKIGDNPNTINSSSLLELESTTKGVLVPRMTETQRTTIASPPTGLMLFQTDATSGFYFYNGAKWEIFLSDTLKTHTAGRNLVITGKGAGATKTTTVIIGNGVAEEYAMNDELFFDVSDARDYAGGDLLILVDFVPTGAETGRTIRWNAIYKAYAPGAVITGTTGTLDSGDIALSATQYADMDHTFTIPAAALVGAKAIHFKIKRVAIGAGSDPASDPAVTHCNIRYNAIR
jgi:hypothetical protein